MADPRKLKFDHIMLSIAAFPVKIYEDSGDEDSGEYIVNQECVLHGSGKKKGNGEKTDDHEGNSEHKVSSTQEAAKGKNNAKENDKKTETQ